jgi:hypothetical protein
MFSAHAFFHINFICGSKFLADEPQYFTTSPPFVSARSITRLGLFFNSIQLPTPSMLEFTSSVLPPVFEMSGVRVFKPQPVCQPSTS